MGQSTEQVFEQIMSNLKEIEKFVDKANERDKPKKNSQIHLLLETDLMDRLRTEAKEKQITISEVCRQKIRDSDELCDIMKSLAHLKKLVRI